LTEVSRHGVSEDHEPVANEPTFFCV